jgi:flagellar protein FlgJ
MGVTSAITPPVDVLMAQSKAQSLARAKVKETAQAYEASFLSVMLAQMFKDVGTEAPFGGGQGEEMFKSFFVDAVAKQVTRSGGIGLAGPVEREMLKLQGLQEEVPHGA